jgi:hypothetical protein
VDQEVRWTPWRKARASGNQGGNCVEVAAAVHRMAVRDSKDPTGPVLTFQASAWVGFLESVRRGSISR